MYKIKRFSQMTEQKEFTGAVKLINKAKKAAYEMRQSNGLGSRDSIIADAKRKGRDLTKVNITPEALAKRATRDVKNKFEVSDLITNKGIHASINDKGTLSLDSAPLYHQFHAGSRPKLTPKKFMKKYDKAVYDHPEIDMVYNKEAMKLARK